MARDSRITFKIADDKKAELEKVADEYGVSVSALCALVLGQWLHQQNKIINPMIQALTETLQKQAENALNKPE